MGPLTLLVESLTVMKSLTLAGPASLANSMLLLPARHLYQQQRDI